MIIIRFQNWYTHKYGHSLSVSLSVSPSQGVGFMRPRGFSKRLQREQAKQNSAVVDGAGTRQGTKVQMRREEGS